MKILEVDTEKRRLGNFGEREAEKHLKKKGYRILGRNFDDGEHEIDIIAKNRDTLAFVEVKTRSEAAKDPREPRPASAVTPEKQRGLISAARAYLSLHPSDLRLRFDIIEVTVSGEADKWKLDKLCHIEGAFNKNTAFRPKYHG
ncbi:MAG: YraN family protein [Clostridia bacterium]|nr:YraN family protein [Clostridia bacterium]